MNWNLSFLALPFILAANTAFSQYKLSGKVRSGSDIVVGATVTVAGNSVITDTLGKFIFKELSGQEVSLRITSIGFQPFYKKFKVQDYDHELIVELMPAENILESVVVSGALKEVSKSESIIAVDIIKPELFRKNASPGLFEGLQMISGVRPQVNCSICNTGDIHINGMEGPYTAVLVDGMPIVSSLGTVYGLLGIPTGMIERLEVVKGPASTLYGTEAVAGLINIITRVPGKGPRLWMETNLNSWGEAALDLGITVRNNKASWLSGISLFGFDRKIDKNQDGFTDLSLQKRISWFNKISYGKNLSGNLALRYLYEDRWGGQTQWNNRFRGTDQVYGESILSHRFEIIGKNNISSLFDINYSFVSHKQDSHYGKVPFMAIQNIAFAQGLYRISKSSGSYLVGLPLKYTFYEDNTAITAFQPQRLFNPAVFVQYEKEMSSRLKTLAAFRIDYFSNKKWVQSPRLAIKYQSSDRLSNLRLNYGNGFRWVNVFSEDHAALTGARTVYISDDLKPERSQNISANFERKLPMKSAFIGLDLTVFYSYFSNKIISDYDRHPEKIYYDNLPGFLDSKGFSLSLDYNHSSGFRVNTSISLLDIRNHENKSWNRPIFTEKASGTGLISYKFNRLNPTIDYTFNWLSPMRLPLQGASDPRPEYSPFTQIHNLQITHTQSKRFEFFAGIKNLFDFLPYRNIPFLIANASDPFDKQVVFDQNGTAVPTAQNPYGLTFDPSYVYASLQGRRLFGGFRISIE